MNRPLIASRFVLIPVEDLQNYQSHNDHQLATENAKRLTYEKGIPMAVVEVHTKTKIVQTVAVDGFDSK